MKCVILDSKTKSFCDIIVIKEFFTRHGTSVRICDYLNADFDCILLNKTVVMNFLKPSPETQISKNNIQNITN